MHERRRLEAGDNNNTNYVDLGNAAIYVGGIQAITGVLSASIVSIATCWFIPERATSSIRTLALSTLAGSMCVCVSA